MYIKIGTCRAEPMLLSFLLTYPRLKARQVLGEEHCPRAAFLADFFWLLKRSQSGFMDEA
jgi:hypothetical protein